MYRPATLEKRKIGEIFVVNIIFLQVHAKAQVVHTKAKIYIPTFVSSQDLVYRSPAELVYKINFTSTEVSNTKPLIIIIPMLKYIITVINTGRQIIDTQSRFRWEIIPKFWKHLQLGFWFSAVWETWSWLISELSHPGPSLGMEEQRS